MTMKMIQQHQHHVDHRGDVDIGVDLGSFGFLLQLPLRYAPIGFLRAAATIRGRERPRCPGSKDSRSLATRRAKPRLAGDPAHYWSITGEVALFDEVIDQLAEELAISTSKASTRLVEVVKEPHRRDGHKEARTPW